jgi:hypothetical protein
MISKEQYVSVMKKEFDIIKHLGEKVTEEQWSWKPTEGQRTMGELMHYLTYIFLMGGDSVASGDGEAYKKYISTEAPTLSNFSQMMDAEWEKFLGFVNSISEEDMQTEVMMWGRNQSKAMHLLGLLSIAAAYKTQLFLYMKQTGMEHLNTMNLWAGMDTPPKE